MNLTIVIPSYNNLEYLTLCYKSIRAANADVKLLLIDDGSSDGTKSFIDLMAEIDKNVIPLSSPDRKGHTYWYDVGFYVTTTDYIGIMHADMAVPSNFFDVLIPHLNENDVVSAKCIEPPLHPPGAEKIVKDFGMYPTQFNSKAFSEFVESESKQMEGKTSPSLFAPWFIHRQRYYDLIGKHDIQFAPYGWEDADLFVRMMKAGFNPVQVQSLLVYHFTQRGHRWHAGKVGTAHTDYQLQMHITRNRFASKWGTLNWKNELHTPNKIPSYYRQLRVKNYQYGNNPYEFINVFFNKIVTDDGILYDDGRGIQPNYEVVLDYNIAYDINELQMFLSQLPFMVEEVEEGDYEMGSMVIRVYNKQEQ